MVGVNGNTTNEYYRDDEGMPELVWDVDSDYDDGGGQDASCNIPQLNSLVSRPLVQCKRIHLQATVAVIKMRTNLGLFSFIFYSKIFD